MQSLSELVTQAESEIAAASDLVALDAVRVKYLGKKGELTARLKGLSGLSAEERPAAGQEINIAKNRGGKTGIATVFHDKKTSRFSDLKVESIPL